MIENKAFFGNEGLTSTSANHICNLAKESYVKYEAILNNISFYETSVTLIGSKEFNIIEYGTYSDTLNSIPNILSKITKLKSLQAWLMEAIKEKQKLLDYYKHLTIYDYCQLCNIEFPSEVIKDQALTEDAYYANLSVKERNRYYALETEAAVIGKVIHKNGSLNNAKAKLFDKINHPTRVEESGRDTLIYNYTPTVKSEDVEKVYFELQKRHREIQAELNSIKHKCDIAINNSEIEVNNKYRIEYNKASIKLEKLGSDLAEFILNKTSEINNYKIIIPNDLKDIYDEVKQLGK